MGGERKGDVPSTPATVGRYDILLPIASGGMARVYLARSCGARGFERNVALKLSHAHISESSEFTTLLLEEAKLATQIRHQNVVPVLDLGEDPLGLFMVMEYVEGDSLSGLVSRARKDGAPLPVAVGMRILLDALAGLHAAHELRDGRGVLLNVVHRDFSPQNILVGIDGVGQLTDFGVAKARTHLVHTATGVIKGKLRYMAPEQARGQATDRRADVWAAGVIAWELIAARPLYPPTGSDGGVSTLLKLVSETPPLLRTVVPDVSPELEAVVARSLTRDVALRYGTAAAFAGELARVLSATGQLASSAEVAAAVQTLAGARLAERRKQVEQAIQLRSNLNALAAASINASLVSTSSHSRDARRAPSSAHLPVQPVLAAEPVTDLPNSDTTLSGSGGSTLPIPRGHSNRRRRRALTVAVAAVISGLTLLALVLGVSASRSSSMAAASRGVIRTPVSSASPSPSPSPAAAVAPPATTTSAATSQDDVSVRADAPIAAMSVGQHNIAIASPTPEVTFTRKDDERSQSLTIRLLAADGRRVSTTLPAESTTLRVKFPPASATTPSKPAKPNCDPPYYVNSEGVRMIKRQCF